MSKPGKSNGLCAISGKEWSSDHLVPISLIRPRLTRRMRRDHPELADTALISQETINHYRHLYVEELLAADGGELTALERDVARRIADQGAVTCSLDIEVQRTFGETVSDGLASFGGSWKFLISFGLVLAAWLIGNLAAGVPFDPYPFILLNLVLSCLAAVQAPIIMMSQRRQEDKDRLRAQNDYQVNLKAELEIQYLHEKLDHLMSHQWQRLAEIQQIQLDLMEEARRPR
ncbi:DUF1003 domain-containing protein [Lacibacterium aquatile]|uniref:DUF1003 domain-containing protein n=1 Tax=Lacibacterium aquatile TaxID=1168082 RepID=A0ABW5DPH4_9PROT